jgi:hypothetical protein
MARQSAANVKIIENGWRKWRGGELAVIERKRLKPRKYRGGEKSMAINMAWQ